jgi:hypothetical protein
MDCSTFSCDLHVLSAPPALILSRDQTLIEKCRVVIAPALLRNTDEFFFTASNQIVKDLRSRNSAIVRSAEPDCRPRNLFAASRHYKQPRDRNLRSYKKNQQEGRIPLDTVARTEFCYHSLLEDFPFIPATQLDCKRRTIALNSVTCSEYQSYDSHARGFAKNTSWLSPNPLMLLKCKRLKT